MKPEVIAEHQRGLEALRILHGDEVFGKFQKAAIDMRKVAQRGTIDLFVHAGMISKAQAAHLYNTNQFWAPLVKYTDDAAMLDDPFTLRYNIKQGNIRGPGGVKEQLDPLRFAPSEFTQKADPFTEVISRMQRSASWYERQMYANRVIELSKEFPGEIPLKPAARIGAEPPKNSIRYFKDGKVYYYTGDKQLVDLLNGSTAADLRMWRAMFSKVGIRQAAQVFRSGVTLTTRFLVKNLLRDPIQADVLSKSGGPFFEFLMRGLWSRMSKFNPKSEAFTKLYETQNIKFSTLAMMESERGGQAAQKIAQGAQARPEGVLGWIQEIGSSFEEVTRRGVLHKGLSLADPKEIEHIARAIGVKPADLMGKQKSKPMLLAAQETWDKLHKNTFRETLRDMNLSDIAKTFKEQRASRLTLNEVFADVREAPLDFAHMGARASALNSIKPFFNAAVRDLEMAMRMAKNQPILFWGRMMKGIVIPSAILYALNRDDPDYQEQPAYKRALNWFIHKKKDGQWITLPKPHMLGILGSMMAEMAWDTMADNDPMARDWGVRELVQQLPFGESVATFFMPRGEEQDVVTRGIEAGAAAFPQFAGPAAEAWANKDIFRGTQLEPDTMQREPHHLRFRESTPLALREAAALANEYNIPISPIKLHHLIRGYTGYLGEGVVRSLDEPIRAVKGEERPVPPEDFEKRIPLWRGLTEAVEAQPARGLRSQSVRDLYQIRNNLQSIDNEIKAYKKRRLHGKASDIKSENLGVNFLDNLNDGTRRIGDLQDKIDKLLFEGVGDMSIKERRKLATEMEERQTEIARNLLERYEKIYK